MHVEYLSGFIRDLNRLPDRAQDGVRRAVDRLTDNAHHPGLRVKKMLGYKNIWEARVSHRYRITFHMTRDVIYLRRVGPHRVEQKP